MTKRAGILDKLIKPFARRHNRELQKEEEDLQAIASKETKVFRYEILAAATRNFSSKHKLGEGGFGPVYKGQLEDGRLVAIKRLGRWSLQGGNEFTNEAMLLSRVQHKNVVTLYGYCTHAEVKLLVYEYVHNESLDKILFSRSVDFWIGRIEWDVTSQTIKMKIIKSVEVRFRLDNDNLDCDVDRPEGRPDPGRPDPSQAEFIGLD